MALLGLLMAVIGASRAPVHDPDGFARLQQPQTLVWTASPGDADAVRASESAGQQRVKRSLAGTRDEPTIRRAMLLELELAAAMPAADGAAFVATRAWRPGQEGLDRSSIPTQPIARTGPPAHGPLA